MVRATGMCHFCQRRLVLTDESGRFELEPWDGKGVKELPRESVGVKRKCPSCGKTVYSYIDDSEGVVGYPDHKRGWYSGELDV